MEVSVISIGNSRGIRLSKTLIEKYHITDSVEVILEKDYMILKAKQTPRKGWDKAFEAMSQNGDDASLIPDVFEDENWDEWK